MLLHVPSVSAEVVRMSVRIDGLACPFCVYGIEKKLGGVPGVREVHVDLETGLARLSVVEGEAPSPSEVERAIERAGFTPREVRVTVIGTPAIEKDSVVLRVRGSERVYFLFRQGTAPDDGPEQALHERLLAQMQRDEPIVVSGVLQARADGPIALAVHTVEALGGSAPSHPVPSPPTRAPAGD